jgi:hypothetical protein
MGALLGWVPLLDVCRRVTQRNRVVVDSEPDR